jgi:hypothetical protein
VIKGGVFCQDCAERYRARQEEEVRRHRDAEQRIVQARWDGIIEAVRMELAGKISTRSDPKYAAKLEALRDLVSKGTLTTSEFDALKPALLLHWSQGESYEKLRGRFGGMYEQAKELASGYLVAPATAKYPPLDPDMIIFVDCESHQFVINTYVDSQARSSALLRSQFRAKFDLESGKCLGISLFQDVDPPWQKMEWGPYVLE